MNISEPFIKRPVATTLLMAAITLAGGIAFNFLPVAPLPQVEFPTISVNAGLPGASPETMASSVATPLERQFGRIAGVTEMTSTSRMGSASVTIAVRPEPQHRCGGARCPGRHQRGPQPAPGSAAQQPHLPENESGERADHDSRLDLRHLRRHAGIRCRRLDPGAKDRASGWRWAGFHGWRRPARRARGTEPYGVEQVRHRHG